MMEIKVEALAKGRKPLQIQKIFKIKEQIHASKSI
jgi:hypothetical protein